MMQYENMEVRVCLVSILFIWYFHTLYYPRHNWSRYAIAGGLEWFSDSDVALRYAGAVDLCLEIDSS